MNNKGLITGKLREKYTWRKVYMGIYGPVHNIHLDYEIEGGKVWLLTMLDAFTRTVEIAILKNITTEDVTTQLYNYWLSRDLLPEEVHTDKGTQFTAATFIEFCR